MENADLHYENKIFRHVLSGKYKQDPDSFIKKFIELLLLKTKANKGFLKVSGNRKDTIWASENFEKTGIGKIVEAFSKGELFRSIQNYEIVKTCSANSDRRFSSIKNQFFCSGDSVLLLPFINSFFEGFIYLQGDKKFNSESEKNIDDIKLILKNIIPVIEEVTKGRKARNSAANAEGIEGIVGNSKAFSDVLRRSLMVAPLDINVLLTGDTGTGKTLVARVIHKRSLRKDNPFVEINCAALPDALIENELFGSAPGGHSGALTEVKGKVQAAKGGTLFLDEIGELSFSVQAKLLNFMQSGYFYPLGASKPVKSDVRIITATNTDLKEAIKNRKFREDLFFRINVFPIDLPPLSKRKEDIRDLVLYFCKGCCKKHGFNPIKTEESAVTFLKSLKWNGNIRELKHSVETAVINAVIEGDDIVEEKHFNIEFKEEENRFPIENFKNATLLFQKEFIRANLEERNWNVSRTAKDISISRSQLNNLIKTFHLNRVEDSKLNGNFKIFNNTPFNNKV